MFSIRRDRIEVLQTVQEELNRETSINFSRLLTYGITFKEFASLAKRRGWTPEYLAQKFRGKIDGPSEFFHRVLSGKPDWSVSSLIAPY